MNQSSLIHINGSYTIGYMYSNIRGSKGSNKIQDINLFIPRAIIKNIPISKNLFLREGILILKNEMQGHTLKDPKLSDKVKFIEARKYLLDNTAKSFNVERYIYLNF